MEDLIILAILAVVLGAAIWYVRRSRKRGHKCIGCPNGGCSCSAQNGEGCCGCGCGSALDGK